MTTKEEEDTIVLYNQLCHAIAMCSIHNGNVLTAVRKRLDLEAQRSQMEDADAIVLMCRIIDIYNE